MRFPLSFVIIFISLIASSLIKLTNRQLASKEKLAKAKGMSFYLGIFAHFNIAKHSKIIERILENIQVKKRDRNERRQEKRCKAVLSNFLFSVTRPGSAV